MDHGCISFLFKTRQLVWVDGLDKKPWNQQGCRATPETVNWNVENAQSLGFGLPQFGWTLNFLLRFFKVEVCGGIKIVLTCKEYSKDSWPSIFFLKVFSWKPPHLFHNLICFARQIVFQSPGRCERNWQFSKKISFWPRLFCYSCLLLQSNSNRHGITESIWGWLRGGKDV